MRKTTLFLIVMLVLNIGYLTWDICRTPFIDYRLTPYYQEVMGIFVTYCDWDKLHKRRPIIKFGKLKNDDVGMCIKKPYGYEIVIEPDYWFSTDEDSRYALIAHELMHCVMGAKHVQTVGHFMYAYTSITTKQKVNSEMLVMLNEACPSERR